MKVIAVIIAGGMGTRLWPVSREMYPKHLLKPTGEHTLLEATYRRALMIPGVTEVLIVTSFETYSLLDPKRFRSQASVSLSFIIEPVSRNTCAAICAASLAVRYAHGDDAYIVAMPADHVVDGIDEFVFAMDRGLQVASTSRLVVFGVPATDPETGYGYIECAEMGNDASGRAAPVSRFVEKPDLEVARRFAGSGYHLWNTGMVCFRPLIMLREMELLAPQLTDAVRESSVGARDLSTEYAHVSELQSEAFARSEDISIDHAILERSSRVSAISCKFGWKDIGCWKAMSALLKPDPMGNRVDGEVRLLDTTGCYIRTESRLVAAIGLKDMIVIDSDDVLLIVPTDRAQGVKQLVAELRAGDYDCVRRHRTVHRPWGCYTVLADDDRFKVKRLVLKPGGSLSLQLHRYRAEHWVLAKGTAEVTIGDSVAIMQPPASMFVPAETRHRIANVGTNDVVVIEVQFGEPLSEDDIVRFDDAYGRA